jgi:hypothetical protein
VARAFLAEQRREAVPLLLPVTSDHDLLDLYDRMTALPELDLSCQLRLPRLLPPEVERLRNAIVEDDAEEAEAALFQALAVVDTPMARAGLARAVLAQRDVGRVDATVAASAVFNLATANGFLEAALVAALAVDGGAVTTPMGLILTG